MFIGDVEIILYVIYIIEIILRYMWYRDNIRVLDGRYC